jgi:hypothetical protein
MNITPRCPYCRSWSTPATGAELYPHRADLAEKKFFECRPCDAFVGVHVSTGLPLGTLANAELRKLRSAAHRAFDPVWQDAAFTKWQAQASKTTSKPLAYFTPQFRTAAYARLAKLLDITVENCHIGCFDATQCRRVIDLCNSREIHRSR